MNVEIFKEYADIKIQIKTLEAKAKEIESEVSKNLEESGAEQIESDLGKFYFTSRKKWTYSEKVTEIEGTLKNTKKEEEENGTAKAEESKSLTFRAK